MMVATDLVRSHLAANENAVPSAELVSRPALEATAIVLLSANWIAAVVLGWLP